MSAPQTPRPKLFVGNLDTRVTEYNLIKLFEQGPHKGESRGIAFVTFSKLADAERAVAKLNGVPVLGRKMTVSFANETVPPPHGRRPQRLPPTEESERASALGRLIVSSQAPEDRLRALEARIQRLDQAKTTAEVAPPAPPRPTARYAPYETSRPRDHRAPTGTK